VLRLLATFDQESVRLAVECEREVLNATGGTCRSPIGALAAVTGDSFTLLVGGVNSDGSGKRIERVGGARGDAMKIAADAGKRLLAEVTLR
jgi:porphobilinogen deaminase